MSDYHWYDRVTGEPRHEAGIKVAREERLLPSVTTITSAMSNPWLAKWIVGNTVEAALAIERFADEPMDSLKERIIEASNEKKDTAAEFGTKIHDLMERLLLNRSINGDPETDPWRPVLVQWIADNVREVIWTEKTLISPALGYAGRGDAMLVLKDAGKTLCDFKTQGMKSYNGKKPQAKFYDSWPLQLAAYQRIEPCDECASIVINSTEPPDRLTVKVWPKDKLASALEAFDACRVLWAYQKNYRPWE